MAGKHDEHGRARDPQARVGVRARSHEAFGVGARIGKRACANSARSIASWLIRTLSPSGKSMGRRPTVRSGRHALDHRRSCLHRCRLAVHPRSTIARTVHAVLDSRPAAAPASVETARTLPNAVF